MDRKRFNRYEAIIGACLGAVVGWSVATGNATLVVIAIAIGLFFEFLCRKRLTEIVEDERIYRISERASRRTFQVFVIAAGIAGAVLIALSKSGYPWVYQTGLTLASSVCILLIIYMVFYGYYNKRGLD